MPCASHTHRRHNHSTQSSQWHDPMTDMLIDERERGNAKYHNNYGISRQEFWASVFQGYILFYMFFKKDFLNNSFVNLE